MRHPYKNKKLIFCGPMYENDWGVASINGANNCTAFLMYEESIRNLNKDAGELKIAKQIFMDGHENGYQFSGEITFEDYVRRMHWRIITKEEALSRLTDAVRQRFKI